MKEEHKGWDVVLADTFTSLEVGIRIFRIRGIRASDKVWFAECGRAEEEEFLRWRFEKWLDAPLKSSEQSLDDYMESKEYKDFLASLVLSSSEIA